MGDVTDPWRRPPYSDEFQAFYNDMKTVMTTVGHLYINIYNDASGNSVANDSNGNPIQHRLVSYIIYTYSGAEVTTSQSDFGGMHLAFSDGSLIQFPNSATLIYYWYTIDGITPSVIKAFT
uniref:Uncharacterized protein n=1 Tax=viral metagenome TaxID=1070528 RepID=A0A6C0DRU8_9ZZZZ